MSQFARLYRSQVTPGASGETPHSWIVFLHGILGSGANWASFARRFVEARPDWGALLVDLRLHGRSAAGENPHTVNTAAQDVVKALEEEGIAPVAVSGHSFGSKIAYRVAKSLRTPPESVWILDADPGKRSAEEEKSLVLRVISTLRQLPSTYARRGEFIEALTSRGYSESLAGWLGKNLVRENGVLQLQVDLDAIEVILHDYHQVDLWSEIEERDATGGGDPQLNVVLGGRSDVITPRIRSRIEQARDRGLLLLHELPDAGHWVHIDAPRRLLELFVKSL